MAATLHFLSFRSKTLIISTFANYPLLKNLVKKTKYQKKKNITATTVKSFLWILNNPNNFPNSIKEKGKIPKEGSRRWEENGGEGRR